MLKGRLGLETARIPHADRSGLLWLSRGALTARDGTLSFERGPNVSENDPLEPGHYAIPFQGVSMILLGPGSTVSHDALRLLARHGTALAAVGEDGVRCYTAPPLIADRSGLARRQARAWADTDVRLQVGGRAEGLDIQGDAVGAELRLRFGQRGACTPGAWARCSLIATLRFCVASKGPG